MFRFLFKIIYLISIEISQSSKIVKMKLLSKTNFLNNWENSAFHFKSMGKFTTISAVFHTSHTFSHNFVDVVQKVGSLFTKLLIILVFT